MINLQNYQSFFTPPVNEEKSPEMKKEHELDTDDRMYLINKKIDQNFLLETYDNLILNKNYVNSTNSNSSINDYVYNDIEFLQDHYLNDEKSIFSKLNNCNTKFGSLLLKKILFKPINDVDILKDRQSLIKKISGIKEELIPLLKEISEIENDLIWFWNDANMKHIELMNDLIYFNYDIFPFFDVNEKLNSNEKALFVSNIYKIVVSPILTIITPILSVIVPLILIFYFQRKTNLNIPYTVIIKQYFKTLIGNDSMKLIFKSPTKAMIANLITKGLYIFMYIQNIYYSLQNSRNTNKIINTIHEKLNKINKYIKISNEIKRICSEKGEMTDLSSFINYNKIEDDLSFYEVYFNSSVFENEPSLFSNKGKILTTFRNFKKSKDDMINLFHYNGIIDLLISIDQLLSGSCPENPYTLTTFLQNSKKPALQITGIWHPYLNDKNTVKNNVEMKNNILITGPNAAGKSTFIKAVVINIIMAQTIGLNSATSFSLTPFHLIETYLHIPDSKGVSSLFEAEMFRSKEYIDKIKNMDKDKFSFIVLDEIFSSTNYVEGFSGAYSILKKMASFKNTLSITTTHYTDLEILEKNTKGRIVNYKFDVDYDKDKNIIFNYKLKRGTSRQYIALKLLEKNGFDEDVIEEAIKMCNKIKKKKLLFNKKNSKDT
mgnify:CR=1 FL=1